MNPAHEPKMQRTGSWTEPEPTLLASAALAKIYAECEPKQHLIYFYISQNAFLGIDSFFFLKSSSSENVQRSALYSRKVLSLSFELLCASLRFLSSRCLL